MKTAIEKVIAIAEEAGWPAHEHAADAQKELDGMRAKIRVQEIVIESMGDRICVMRDILAKRAEKQE